VTRDDVAVAIEVTSRFLELLDPQED